MTIKKIISSLLIVGFLILAGLILLKTQVNDLAKIIGIIFIITAILGFILWLLSKFSKIRF